MASGSKQIQMKDSVAEHTNKHTNQYCLPGLLHFCRSLATRLIWQRTSLEEHVQTQNRKQTCKIKALLHTELKYVTTLSACLEEAVNIYKRPNKRNIKHIITVLTCSEVDACGDCWCSLLLPAPIQPGSPDPGSSLPCRAWHTPAGAPISHRSIEPVWLRKHNNQGLSKRLTCCL